MSEPKAQVNRSPELTEAWILGTGTASFASALHLVFEAKLPPSKVHILDSHISMGQAVYHNGDPVNGYDQFAACLPVPSGEPIKQLFDLVPSVRGQGKSLWEEIQSAEAKHVSTKHGNDTRFLVQKDGYLKDIATTKLGMSTRHRLRLVSLMFKGEKRLGRNQIRDFLPNSFFQSPFWAIWSAQFGFQPWHSAAEFKRAVREYLREFHTLSIITCLDITGYYQFESIFLPLYVYLQSLGVDFHFDTTVTDILTSGENNNKAVSQLNLIQNGFPVQQKIGQHDIVIISIGSTISGATRGTNNSPPDGQSIEPNDKLDENWSLWLEIGTKSHAFGNPYNFCTRQAESTLQSFTITTADLTLFDHLQSISHSNQAGAFITLPESPWRLNLCIPWQPVFDQQPSDIRVLWGSALEPRRKGKFVKKPMTDCSGMEVTIELLGHLNYPSLVHHTITIPRVMPRMSAGLLARSSNDRPGVIPQETCNLGLIGPFVEIPRYSCVDVSYGVRTAQLAVSQLMGLHRQRDESKKPLIFDILRVLFWD
ncbi:hypothetical protein NUU61_002646 [Penicillium alfredii]|uniref:Oleate hydratase n=1 Tax=Penicillium alfredii TaxID=1506179 RepID=A0A9W9KG58_9EURO|nr:uncharacterized protein NUU61_002646 [Penicillium alfredii]KAJ5105299.1 hypothetical protein NUU61_002646 [Penicillium alfredii]